MNKERMARLYMDGSTERLRHNRMQLREVSAVRTVGFRDAVDDLGTHRVHGMEVGYSTQQVYAVLQGRHRSERLLRRIAERRPELLSLRYVAPEVREAGERYRAEAEREAKDAKRAVGDGTPTLPDGKEAAE